MMVYCLFFDHWCGVRDELCLGCLLDVQTAMPLAVEIQKDLLTKYGYPQDFMGAMQMIMAIRMAAMSDPELMAQVTLLQNKIMPKA